VSLCRNYLASTAFNHLISVGWERRGRHGGNLVGGDGQCARVVHYVFLSVRCWACVRAWLPLRHGVGVAASAPSITNGEMESDFLLTGGYHFWAELVFPADSLQTMRAATTTQSY